MNLFKAKTPYTPLTRTRVHAIKDYRNRHPASIPRAPLNPRTQSQYHD